MEEWLSLLVGAVDELVVDIGIGIVRTGISLVADIAGSLLGRGSSPSHGTVPIKSIRRSHVTGFSL